MARAKEVKVQWKAGYRPPSGVTPDGTARELARLMAEGPITTARILEAAAPEDSEIHGICEWDDAEAAYAHRLEQCSRFIRGTMIIIGKSDPQPFIHVPARITDEETGRAGAYHLANVLPSRPDDFASALAEAHRALQSARARVQEIELMIPEEDARLDALRIAFQGFDAVQAALRVIGVAVPA